MPSQRQTSIQGFHLPDVIDPPDHYCVSLKVPKDQWHVAAFLGAIFELTQWTSWQRDPARQGTLAASVWRDIWMNLELSDCQGASGPGGTIQEDFMPIRVDCDCRVWVTCCDGTEKELATMNDVQKQRQPGSGEGPTPPKPGGNVQDCYLVMANQVWPFPAAVNGGDTLEVVDANGSASDSGGLANWFCPDGTPFAFGKCVGVGGPLSGDPAPSLNHMRLVWNFNGTFVDAMGGAVTVPGTGPVLVGLQVNDSDITNDPGSFTVCVKWTSNAVETFTHTFDLETDPGAWVNYPGDSPDTMQWTPGQGIVNLPYAYTPTGNTYSGVQGQITFPSRTITDVQVTFDRTHGDNSPSSADPWFGVFTNAATLKEITPSDEDPNGTGLMRQWSGSAVATKLIILVNDTGIHTTTYGSGRTRKIVVSGIGTDPF